MATANLTAQRLREFAHYDPSTGALTRRFAAHSHKAGKRLGCLRPDGYLVTRIDGVLHRVHRLAWLYVHGEFPAVHIDHIDGGRTNNRITNLRPADDAQNNQNRHRTRCDNVSSGLIGASRSRSKKRWVAKIAVDKRQIYLGTFDTAMEAHMAYLDAKRVMHPAFSEPDQLSRPALPR
jgi:hypothetical protein